MRSGGCIHVALAVIGTLLVAVFQATNPARAEIPYYKKIFGAWTVQCERAGRAARCSLTATASNGPLVVGISVEKPVTGDSAVAVALADYSFDTSAVGIRVDKRPSITTGPKTEKYAVFDGAFSRTLIASFAAGRRALVHFQLAPSGQRQAVLVSLRKFKEALEAYSAQVFLIHPSSLG